MQRAAQLTHYAVERQAFLGAAGEIDAARRELGFKIGTGENGVEVVRQQRTQRGELLREQIAFRTRLRVALHNQRIRQARVQTLLQQRIFLTERAGEIEIGQLRPLPRKGEAPDLFALRFIQLRKPGAEAFQQVRLGHQHIDRKTDAQLFMQLRQTLTQIQRLLLRRFRRLS